MAVTWTDRTLRMAAQGDGVDSRFSCETIVIRPSGASWVVVIKDLDGVATKFEASGAANESFTANVTSTIFNGAVAVTLTNITSVTFNGTKHIYNAAL